MPAAASTAETVYKDAISAFHAGDHARALAGFLKAQELGIDSPRLHFNLGSTYFRLERFDQAREAYLLAAADSDLAELAWYNLGLTEFRRDDFAAAQRWFVRTRDEGSNPDLQVLAQAMLDHMADRAPTGRSAWSGFLLTEIGYDDNVTLQADTETIDSTEQGDLFVSLFGQVSNRVYGTSEKGASLEGMAYLLRHRDLDRFDISLFRLRGALNRSQDRWHTEVGAHADASFVADRGFTRSLTMQLQARRAIGRNGRVHLGYEISRIDELSDRHAYLAGWRQRATIGPAWRTERLRLRTSYSLEYNDRKDLHAPLFSSFSPWRHEIRADASYRVLARLDSGIGLQYRHSRYRDPNVLADNTTVTRTEDRLRLTARATYNLDKGRELSVELHHTENDSNLDLYTHDQRQYMIGLFIPW